MNEIIETLRNVDTECTSAPYWIIIDQRGQVKSIDPHRIASFITGIFFSRVDAENFLSDTRYNFSKNAIVYCCSGCYSRKYYDLCKSIKKE
jgi:hypothetical protein